MSDPNRGATRPMPQRPRPWQAQAETRSEPLQDLALLPPRVAALRVRILAAAESGDIEQLRIPIEWNEVPPLFERGPGQPRGFAPLIDYLKARSFDRRGREWLSILKTVFAAPYVRIARGPFVTYVWPSFVFADAAGRDEETRLAIWRCVRFADLGGSDAAGHPLIQRAVVGEDGTWHSLMAEPDATASLRR